MQERLQKILARAGIASRRAAEALMLDGRVTVNGQMVTELGSRADTSVDKIAVDGRPVLVAAKHTYIMLNKPPEYVTTRHDPEGRPTVYELVPDVPGLFTVGRLDRETEGLLLLTTDGAWAERIAHPRYQVEREYEVRVLGPVPDDAMARLRDGIMLDGKLARPHAAYQSGQNGVSAILSVVMVEGRKREVRMLCLGAGIRVKRLIRRRIGSIQLGWLGLGQWRNLDVQEVRALGAHEGRSRRATSTRSERQAGDEVEETTTGEGQSVRRHRRAGGVGQVDHRDVPGGGAGFSVSRYGSDVSGSDKPGSGPPY